MYGTGLAAIAIMLISNENDLTGHFGNAFLPDHDVPAHSKRFMELGARFAADHNLVKDKVLRSWEPGPAKLFLNDLEYRFNADMIAHLRSIGAQGSDRYHKQLGLECLKFPAGTHFWGPDRCSFLRGCGRTGEEPRVCPEFPKLVRFFASCRQAADGF